MMVKKFHGASTRDVLKQVRDELGPDALILSNRQLPNGSIEIMAVADTDMAALTAETPLRPAAAPQQPAQRNGQSAPALPNLPLQNSPQPVQRNLQPAQRGALPAGNNASPAQTPPQPAQRSVLPAPSPAFAKVLQRTYALPPELSDDDDLGPTELLPRASPPPAAPQKAPPAFDLRQEAEVEPPPHRASPPQRTEPALAPRHHADEAQAPSQLRVEPTLAAQEKDEEPVALAPAPAPIVAAPAPAAEAAPARVEPLVRVEPKIDGISHDIEDISQEIRMLRSLLEGQLAGLAWNELKRQDPERLEVLRRLLSVGFSPALSRQIVENMPANYSTERGMKWARTALQHNLPTVGPGADIIEAGGVYALVGPTGVGKTTTMAKLAARATLKHGAAKVALVTTDGYRIGAQDQLRIYGKILGVPVYAVTDERDLHQTLADLRNRHLVLLDTVGMSQRDQRVAEQIALLAAQASPVKRLLLLSANAQGTTLDDVVRRYHGGGLTGCIFTKTDEAFSLGAGLDVIVRYKLPLYYITNGQRVPEDLHIASSLYLVDRVFKTPPEAPAYRLKSEEYPLYMGARVEPTLDFSWREQN